MTSVFAKVLDELRAYGLLGHLDAVELETLIAETITWPLREGAGAFEAMALLDRVYGLCTEHEAAQVREIDARCVRDRVVVFNELHELGIKRPIARIAAVLAALPARVSLDGAVMHGDYVDDHALVELLEAGLRGGGTSLYVAREDTWLGLLFRRSSEPHANGVFVRE